MRASRHLTPPRFRRLLLLLLAAAAAAVPLAARGMTLSGVSPNQFGSFGGVRLTLSGSGFGNPFARPTVVLGPDPLQPVAECSGKAPTRRAPCDQQLCHNNSTRPT